MTTFVTLTLSNNEINRLFTRELKNGVNFYQKLMSKVASLIKCCQEQRVYALLSLYQMNEAVNTTTQKFYDDIDKFEGLLEKKKHLAGKKITYQPVHFPEVRVRTREQNRLCSRYFANEPTIFCEWILMKP